MGSWATTVGDSRESNAQPAIADGGKTKHADERAKRAKSSNAASPAAPRDALARPEIADGDPGSAIHPSCSFTSCALWMRSSGSLARQRAHQPVERGRRHAAQPARSRRGLGSCMIAAISDAWLVPSNARRPVAIS